MIILRELNLSLYSFFRGSSQDKYMKNKPGPKLKILSKKFCKKCGKEIKPRLKNGHINYSTYCSLSCRRIMLDLPKRFCKFCNKLLNSRNKNGRINRSEYCDSKCQHKSLEVAKFCKVCGERIPRLKSSRRCRATIYCSRECYGLDKKPLSNETKRKIRVSTINYISSICKITPIFNLAACKFFDEFDKAHKTNGQYATKGGEYHIKELGYFLDYINFDKKVIIEWNESKHYKKGVLRNRDVVRQKEIQSVFNSFTFIQLNEKDDSFKKVLLQEIFPETRLAKVV